MRRQPLTSDRPGDEQMLVVDAGRRIDEMHRRDVALAALRRGDAALAADRDGARADAALGERADHHVERDVVAAHDDDVGRACAAAPISVTRAGVSASSEAASASISMKPSACEKLVTAPEPFAEGNAIGAVFAGHERHQHELLAAHSEAMRSGTRASTVSAASGGRPARARITGATKAWKVKIAEVGKPGSTAIGLPPATARQSGLPGLSATPCTRMPGSPSFDTTRCERSPAPFEVPPDSTTMSHSASARRTACSSAAGRPGTRRMARGSPPASAMAAARIAPLLS